LPSKLSQAIKEDTIFIRNTIPILQTQQHDTIIRWLSPTDFPALQHDIISRRQESTGQWFLGSRQFNSWLQGVDKILFCPGIPGAGKTMIASIAIDHISKLAQADIGLAYIFCNYKSQVGQSLYSLLSALLKQLVQSRTEITDPVTHLYNNHSKQKSRPSLDEIFTALVTVCLNHTRVFFVVDALDECTADQRNQLVERLRELQTRTNMQLMLTSRFIPEITSKFQSDLTLEIRATEEDVKHFVAGQIPRLPSCIKRDDQLKLMVQSKIVEAIDGM
jgi:hypothetical protein